MRIIRARAMKAAAFGVATLGCAGSQAALAAGRTAIRIGKGAQRVLRLSMRAALAAAHAESAVFSATVQVAETLLQAAAPTVGAVRSPTPEAMYCAWLRSMNRQGALQPRRLWAELEPEERRGWEETHQAWNDLR